MTSWLDEIVDQHRELESPLSFWRWSAIAAISAVVKDNVWLNRQIYNLYPNIYVMLHADSGLKKGPPVSMAKRLVKMVNNTNIISGRSSIQGILKDMGSGHTQPGGKVISKSNVFICSSELSSSIVEDKVAMTILTDLYDRQYNEGEWRSLLKMESFQLKNPTVTMLTATNEAHSSEFFDKKDIHGGYFARTFIIYESRRNRPNSLLYPLTNPPDYQKSAEYLKTLSKLAGPFRPLAATHQSDIHTYSKVKDNRELYFTEAGLFYDDWYDEFLTIIDQQETKDQTGTLNRFGDSVLKVAMLLALARCPELEIDLESMKEAIELCQSLVGNIRRATMGKGGMSSAAALKNNIIFELLNRPDHRVSRTLLMKKMWMHYSTSDEFDQIMLSFDSAGLIKTESIGNQVIFRMPDEQANELKRFLEGKQK